MIGEITNDEELKSYTEIAKYVDSGAVLGYGTSLGGYMKVKGYNDELNYLEDRTTDTYPYPNAVSKLDEKNLEKIANDIGIEYIHMEKTENLSNKVNDIKRRFENASALESTSGYNETYYIFAAPLLGLLVYEFISFKKKL